MHNFNFLFNCSLKKVTNIHNIIHLASGRNTYHIVRKTLSHSRQTKRHFPRQNFGQKRSVDKSNHDGLETVKKLVLL